ncbi:type ISP restriction/modification enzyme [Chromatocurvus halotolerans]|uniref:site-specific DNA-methyltransferase (adenine-specific) n=1 Tax=Chromatocurvus halotolerans TaxID=1132028 RepID=A0A4R2L0D9_9GAMM|nr:type ISP restriction/modification enzyme [Chromatocurvus halotolerans]TCO77146.1 N-6 DNA methylase [Chromatocurvus halotolerans]
MALIEDFIATVQAIHDTGKATENSYRSAIESLFDGLGVKALNEPKRVECGAPDFIVSVGDIVIGHIEAKDLSVSVRGLKGNNKEQRDRYRDALPNLIYTNCLEWDFYRDRELVASVDIATLEKTLITDPSQYGTLLNLLSEFAVQRPQTITSPRDLAIRMAGKARLIKDVLHKILIDETDPDPDLKGQYEGFKENLIHDTTPGEFADVYAETIAYGMFTARLHDETLDTFSRQEALELLPKSNPFLKSLFTYVAGYNLDDRISWIIDDLAKVFQACDVAKLMQGFGKLTGRSDPFLHFYETFLSVYSPKKRKARGVWYTPESVVSFIVRAVDEVLQTEFGLPDGLADTSRVAINWDTGQRKRTSKGHFYKDGRNLIEKREVHKVQILDPAVGTGTFLAEVMKQIEPKVRKVAPGNWSQYIEEELIPRLHGFELLMASYAMCHMKLEMILSELGYIPTKNPPRLSVYLTNSLEEGEPPNQELPFSQWISREAKGANSIKRDMPIMCVIGNPPYSGVSQNMGDWISSLIEDYKYVDGQHFGERKHWLHDDYVKFMRFAETLIEKNKEGILGFITNNGYLDNPTFRGMRWHLLNTFDRIYVLDLHGSVKKKELTEEGKSDKNVFDIQQGVAIIIAAKTGTKKQRLAEVWHGDLRGTRHAKYETLDRGCVSTTITERVACAAPQYAFIPQSASKTEAYSGGFKVTDLFVEGSMGVQTSRDALAIAHTRTELEERLKVFCDPKASDDEIRWRFFGHKKAGKYLPGDSRGWSLSAARKKIDVRKNPELLVAINYRPFDLRFTYFSKELLDWPREKIMVQFLRHENLAILFPRQLATLPYKHALVTNTISEMCAISNRTKEQNAVYPLYIYPDDEGFDKSRQVNFDRKIFAHMQELGSHPDKGIPDEVAIFDYVYGVLHCPAYRETYAEFLKSDFPRIPWPISPEDFWDLSSKGAELRNLHLMDRATVGETPYPFTGEGSGVVMKPAFNEGKVWINETQYFDNAPEVAWGFFIGGYQPAEKWLKDRKGRSLSFDDIRHYQRILKILAETDRIMKTIELSDLRADQELARSCESITPVNAT